MAEYPIFFSLGVMSATVTRLSANHIVFQSASFSGDSGSALSLMGGNVIGLHVAGVNEAKELLRLAEANDRFNAVEASIDSLIRTTGHGCVGLLAHVFLPRLEEGS